MNHVSALTKLMFDLTLVIIMSISAFTGTNLFYSKLVVLGRSILLCLLEEPGTKTLKGDTFTAILGTSFMDNKKQRKFEGFDSSDRLCNLKWDPNWFFSPCDLEIWHMTYKNKQRGTSSMLQEAMCVIS